MGKRGRPCTVCQHPKRDEIDKRLASNANFAGISRDYEGISRDFAGISEDALKRHKERHLPGALAKAENIKEVVKADTLLKISGTSGKRPWVSWRRLRRLET